MVDTFIKNNTVIFVGDSKNYSKDLKENVEGIVNEVFTYDHDDEPYASVSFPIIGTVNVYFEDLIVK